MNETPPTDGLHTLGRWTRDRARATPDRVAVDDRGVTLRYHDLDDRAGDLSAAFRAAGYGIGDRVATITGNSQDRVVPGRRADLPERAPQRPVRDDDPLLIAFTSGTLGRAKGVVLTHSNCFWTNLSLSPMTEITSKGVVLAVMPQYHVGGWNIQPLLAWWMGATVVLERTFDPGRVLQLIQDRRITTIMGVLANYLFVAQHPNFAETDLSSLNHAVVGGAPMPAPLLRTWHARGVALTQGYGLTEASPNVLCLPNEDAPSMLRYAGKPYAHVEVVVADPVTGEHRAGASTGELLVRGPCVFSGYFRAPEETARTLRDGWLHTGDLVRRDEHGYFAVIDRLTDIYISGGESVAPAEVENVLFEHAVVADVAVIGVPDDRWGEVGVAFVVTEPGVAESAERLLVYARSQLSGFKVPAHVRFVPQIPRSLGSKVLRRELLASWQNNLVGGAR
ncbi:AMP-binding protein [Cryobacterium psychrophilum]|uniref:Long-chain fatty acid--CoA ligase n=1 Tax=Cryobacterium psychrophilum TaxID=41988 RepID=A0A4Y8KL41_9MICO|nr:AMP-binding protein [Cryobacterium psychrophilum]TDW29131.1 fatty-acyl-CoA synthase [Cryobacterium psychrophilum]TFD77795.1 long-chain fatty acid--CoA ligase [Cryobacterium psychrophilum]